MSNRSNEKSANILIVEGEGDRSFLEQLFRVLGLPAEVVLPATAKDLLDHGYNTKKGAYHALDDRLILLQQADSALKRLAIVVDSDHGKDGQGFSKTLTELTKIFNDYGYEQDSSYTNNGFVFAHKDQNIRPVGAWIMPNNQDDGAIESWIQQCFDPKKCHLLPHAQQTVSDLPDRQFTGNNLPKAEIATWLAWQKRPSIGLYAAVPLLNDQAQPYKDLVNWLQYLFVMEEA
jgi:hypothetical protein